MADFEIELRNGKECIADGYYMFVDKPKDYDKITRNKMLDEMIKAIIDDYTVLYRGCTLPELDMLAKAVSKPIEQSVLSLDNSRIVNSLNGKLLLCYQRGAGGLKIPDMLTEPIKKALKNLNRLELEKKDKYRYIILGLLRIRYFMPLALLFLEFHEYETSLSVEEFFEFLNTDNYLQNKFVTIEEGLEFPIICLENGDNLEEILSSLTEKNYVPSQKYNLEEVVSIGKTGLNLANENILKFYEFVINKCKKGSYIIEFFLKQFIESCSLGFSSPEYLKFFDLEEKDMNKMLELYMNAHNHMPCWLNGGDSPDFAFSNYPFDEREPAVVDKIGRNDLCPCGSGKKYKNCCLDNQKNIANKKTLTLEGVDTVYDLLLGLAVYTNAKYKLFPEIKAEADLYIDPKNLDVEKLSSLLDKLWSNLNIIDEYILKERKYLNSSDTEILLSWKKAIHGFFTLYKYDNGKALVYHDETNCFYEFIGVYNPLSDSIPQNMLPMYIETTLLPFGDVIIYDTLVKSVNIKLGPNLTKELNDKYEELKDKIIKIL